MAGAGSAGSGPGQIDMRFAFGCELTYTVNEPTSIVFSLEAARLASHMALQEELTFSPSLPRREYTVPGLGTRYVGVRAAPGPLSVQYAASTDLYVHRADPASVGETPIAALPLDSLPFLLPSRFVPSDRLAAFALREFGDLAQGHGRVTQICNWIHDNLDYRRGSSDSVTTASEVLLQRAGVCRDFAHLGIAFCRAIGVPARYVSCYAYGLVPADFHAVFEAYLDGRWWLFDPTRQAALDGIVRIGAGRDAAELSFATLFGAAEAGDVHVWIDRLDGGDASVRTAEAISAADELSEAGG
jgi:transglutaminase-like putative cysteine protease